jgi:hypothetical protein
MHFELHNVSVSPGSAVVCIKSCGFYQHTCLLLEIDKIERNWLMGYLMRFISTDAGDITLAVIEIALKQVDPAYAIANGEIDDLGDLMYGETQVAIIEINRPGDDMFEDDLAAFKDMVGQGMKPNESLVRSALENATALIVIEATWEGDDAESTLAKIDPLWEWLFDNYQGLSQADNEGFFDQTGLILERNFTL